MHPKIPNTLRILCAGREDGAVGPARAAAAAALCVEKERNYFVINLAYQLYQPYSSNLPVNNGQT